MLTLVLILKIILVILAIPVVVLLTKAVIKNARRLDEGIEEYHKEQEQGQTDPYSALADLLQIKPDDNGAPDK